MSVRLRRLTMAVGVGGLWLLVASPLVAQPSTPLSRADIVCRNQLFAAVGKMTRSTIVELGKCHSRRMAGLLPNATQCNSAAVAPNRFLLLRDEGLFRARIGKRCVQPKVSPPAVLGFTSCRAPCDDVGDISSYADVADCLICQTRAETSRLVAAGFGFPPAFAGAERQCQLQIGRAMKIYLAAQQKLQRRCHLEQDSGRLAASANCRTHDPRGKLVRARQRLQRALASCGDERLSALDSCGASVAEQQQCLPATLDTAAAAFYSSIFPLRPSTVEVGAAAGVRGQTVAVPVTLAGGSGITNLVELDLDYDPTQVQVATINGTPDCTIDPAIGPGSVADKTLGAFVLPPAAGRQRLRVSIFGVDHSAAIPDGVLFQCRFTISLAASRGTTVLGNTPFTFDTGGSFLPTDAIDGEIEVQPTGLPAIDLVDASGIPGDSVVIAATLANGDGRVASLTSAITYDPAAIGVSGGAAPSCTIDPGIGSGSTADKELDATLSSAAGLETLTVTVLSPDNSELIPDGPLFTCDFDIALTADVGAKLLAHQPSAFDATGAAVAVEGRGGEITVFVPTFVAGSATGTVGQLVSIPVSLSTGDDRVVEAQIDMTYDASQVRVASSDGGPDCTIAAGIGSGTAAAKVLGASVVPGAGGTETLRLELTSPSNSVPLPDGVLVRCNFEIDAMAAFGVNALVTAVAATNAIGAPLLVLGVDGSISVSSLMLPRLDVGNAAGVAGDSVIVDFTFATDADPIVALSIDATYDATRLRVRRTSSGADCVINPAIGPGTVPAKLLLRSVADLGGGIERLRVGVISFSNSNTIPSGPVFTCRFEIDAGAPAGDVIIGNRPSAANSFGDAVLIHGSDGRVTVF